MFLFVTLICYVCAVHCRPVLTPQQELQVPRGPWTKQLKDFPAEFCEESIKQHERAHGAEKHCAAGYRMFKADKVGSVLLHYDKDSTFVKASVQASFSLAKIYETSCILSSGGKVESGRCTCAAGAGGVCKHVAALLWYLLDVQRMGHLFVPDSVSCTSKPKAWGCRSTKRKLGVTSFSDLQFTRHQPGKVPRQQECSAEKLNVPMKVSALKKLCTGFQESGLSPMLVAVIEEAGYEPNKLDQPAESVPTPQQQIRLPLCVADYQTQEDMSACALSLEEAHALEEMTRGQSSVPLWHEERKKRITASRFRDVVTRKAPVTEKFVASIRGSRSAPATKFMKAGLENEASAINKYKDLQNVEVFPIGLCVNPSVPFLGASPDGLVLDKTTGEHGLVEIKTLAKAMEEGLSLEEAINQKKAPFLKAGKLNHRHKYYNQIQGQLGVTGLKWCDLAVDCGRDLYVERIPFNAEVWKGMLPALEQFYCLHMQPNENGSEAH